MGDMFRRNRDEEERRKGTMLAGLIRPGELTLDPEIAREPELAGLTPPRPDAQLGGMDPNSDRLNQIARAAERAYGFRWNPASEEGARNLAAERSAAIKSVYGESPLKQENIRSQITARTEAGADRRAGLEQRRTAAADRAKILRDRLERDKQMDPYRKKAYLAQVKAYEGRGAADQARAAQIEERLPYEEDRALYELDKIESEINRNEASYGESPLKQENIRSQITARTEAGADRRAGLEEKQATRAMRERQFDQLQRDRDRLYELRKTATGDRARLIDSQIAENAQRTRNLATTGEYEETKRDFAPELFEADIAQKKGRAALDQKRAEKIEKELPGALRKLEAAIEKMQGDAARADDLADLQFWRAKVYAALSGQRLEESELKGALLAAKAADQFTPDTRNPFTRVGDALTGTPSPKKQAAAGAFEAAKSGAPEIPSVPSRRPRSSGAQSLPAEKPGVDTSPAAKPQGDITKPATPVTTRAGSVSPDFDKKRQALITQLEQLAPRSKVARDRLNKLRANPQT